MNDKFKTFYSFHRNVKRSSRQALLGTCYSYATLDFINGYTYQKVLLRNLFWLCLVHRYKMSFSQDCFHVAAIKTIKRFNRLAVYGFS